MSRPRKRKSREKRKLVTYYWRTRRRLREKPHAFKAKAAVFYKYFSWHINSPVMKKNLKKFRIVLKKE